MQQPVAGVDWWSIEHFRLTGDALCPETAEAARGERVEVLASTAEQQSIPEPGVRRKSDASALALGDPRVGVACTRSWVVFTLEVIAGLD